MLIFQHPILWQARRRNGDIDATWLPNTSRSRATSSGDDNEDNHDNGNVDGDYGDDYGDSDDVADYTDEEEAACELLKGG